MIVAGGDILIMIESVYTAEEICKAIAADFKMRGLTHGAAAEMLGLCKQTVSNQISGKKKFSLKAAQRYADAFGYSIDFLLFGKGELRKGGRMTPTGEIKPIATMSEDSVLTLQKRLNLAHRLFRVLNNPDALEAFEAAMSDDYAKYCNLYTKLHKDFGWEISVGAVDDEFLDRVRRVLAEAQERRSKDLADSINHLMLNGGHMSVQTLLESCKYEILKLKDEYPEFIVGDFE